MSIDWTKIDFGNAGGWVLLLIGAGIFGWQGVQKVRGWKDWNSLVPFGPTVKNSDDFAIMLNKVDDAYQAKDAEAETLKKQLAASRAETAKLKQSLVVLAGGVEATE